MPKGGNSLGPSQPNRKHLPLHFLCIVFSPVLHIVPSDSVNFKVVSPAQLLMVSVGEDVLLPCHLSPRMNAEDMEVRWFRSNFPEVIHLYQDGKDQPEQQILEFQGRTELLRENITEGSVVLRIHSIRPADEGQYSCFFQSSTFYGAALLELKVAGLGSGPHISVADYEDGGIRVVCTSGGWYPEPEVLWRDSSGQHVPSLSQMKSQQENGLFEAQISVVIKERTHPGLNCYIRNPRLNQEKESTIHIADPFFPRTSLWAVALAVVLSVLGFLIFPAIYYSWMQHREKGKLLAELRWRSAQVHAVDVTLDPATAQSNLILSEDRKSVRHGDTQQDLPDNPERFEPYVIVLGTEGFTGGRHYWEVEVGKKPEWTLGVCRDSVRRKGSISVTSESGYFVVCLRDGEKYWARTSPLTRLPVSVRPGQVGVFLDYEAGEVSFYNVTDRSHLFTFTGTFSGMLRPYFSPCLNEGGKNVDPLIIRPVPAPPGGNPGPCQ
ncbi:butyrophilin subfamily 1 member A1-like isoform X2 [Dermochelys coriacea]|nr:butyrophilin subfamily 1 member A1-like isoform X2 [Dermochelys coriacea]XP_043371320.1 butyrophilin subfamily 1 member A1-like isoform X2 [Dermochelys coriacea]XP_043371321.1 butyrophilin subfamily 1 member A1-like isoform X2 [Dermochelys coriacea]